MNCEKQDRRSIHKRPNLGAEVQLHEWIVCDRKAREDPSPSGLLCHTTPVGEVTAHAKNEHSEKLVVPVRKIEQCNPKRNYRHGPNRPMRNGVRVQCMRGSVEPFERSPTP